LEFDDSTSAASSTDFWLHNNNNNFYILADRDDNGTWESSHPLQFTVGATSAGDFATFSDEVRANSYCERDGTDCFTAAEVAPIDTSNFLTTAIGLQTKAGSLTVNNTLTGGNIFTDGTVRANNFCDENGTNCTLPENFLDTTGTAQTKAGNLTIGGTLTATTFLYSSDARLKRDVRDISGLDTIQSLRGVGFSWNDTGKADYGFIAQDVMQVLPEIVEQDSDGYYAVEYGNVIPFLVEAIKEQQQQIDALEARLDQYEN
jgi:hypothetical protein